MAEENRKREDSRSGGGHQVCRTGADVRAGALCAAATWCRPVGDRSAGAPGPVCVGRSASGGPGGYFWLCRQCVIVYPGFDAEDAARRMARSHSELRWREHAVGRAVRAKRSAGMPADLSTEELRAALREG